MFCTHMTYLHHLNNTDVLQDQATTASSTTPVIVQLNLWARHHVLQSSCQGLVESHLDLLCRQIKFTCHLDETNLSGFMVTSASLIHSSSTAVSLSSCSCWVLPNTKVLSIWQRLPLRFVIILCEKNSGA